MISVFRGAYILIVLTALFLAVPGSAGATAAPAETRVRIITGGELASQFVAGVSVVDIGSRGATLTCEVDGAGPVEFPLDYSAILPDPVTGDARSFILAGLVAGVAVRFLGLLLRLGR